MGELDLNIFLMGIGDWGLGIGDWVVGGIRYTQFHNPNP